MFLGCDNLNLIYCKDYVNYSVSHIVSIITERTPHQGQKAHADKHYVKMKTELGYLSKIKFLSILFHKMSSEENRHFHTGFLQLSVTEPQRRPFVPFQFFIHFSK